MYSEVVNAVGGVWSVINGVSQCSPVIASVNPGDMVVPVLSPITASISIPMVMPHPCEMMENDAYARGSMKGEVISHFGTGDIALVVSVTKGYAYICHNGAYGWVSCRFIVNVAGGYDV